MQGWMLWRQHKGEHLMLETSVMQRSEEMEVEEAVGEDVAEERLLKALSNWELEKR
jgi:hypothetical protein